MNRISVTVSNVEGEFASLVDFWGPPQGAIEINSHSITFGELVECGDIRIVKGSQVCFGTGCAHIKIS